MIFRPDETDVAMWYLIQTCMLSGWDISSGRHNATPSGRNITPGWDLIGLQYLCKRLLIQLCKTRDCSRKKWKTSFLSEDQKVELVIRLFSDYFFIYLFLFLLWLLLFFIYQEFILYTTSIRLFIFECDIRMFHEVWRILFFPHISHSKQCHSGNSQTSYILYRCIIWNLLRIKFYLGLL